MSRAQIFSNFKGVPSALARMRGFVLQVADFGLARVMHDTKTLTGGLGTFQWMSPEVLAHQSYSEKADVYSFAIVLWECTARQVCASLPLQQKCTLPSHEGYV